MKHKKKKLINLCVVMMCCAFILYAISFILAGAENQGKNQNAEDNSQPVTEETENIREKIPSYKIEGVPVIPQIELKSGCETYAATMLMQYLGFDIDEVTFADNYLISRDVSYGKDGNRYGPDPNSAFSGDVHSSYGWCIYCPAMAKSMNNYFKSENSKLVATPIEGVTLDDLCYKYVINDKPVMIWGTTNMEEAYEDDSWIVDYTDENAKYEIGDTYTWLRNEHCLVLFGFDKENYYFCDSCAGDVSVFDKATSEQRYKQLSMQAIVVE